MMPSRPTAPRVAANPFPGLRPFVQDECALFFGRDRQSDELVQRLATHRFVAVVGSSGSGKSSLVRAGLLPSLEAGFMVSAGSHWRVAIARPQDDPIGGLAQALAEPGALAPPGLPAGAARTVIETTLRRSSLGLAQAARLAQLAPHENVLVVIDQFEELFRFADLARQRGTANEPAAFVKLLLEAAAQTELPVFVVLTMRSDFLGDCARFRDLPEAISDSQYLVPRLTRDELQAVITGPIGVRGGRIEPAVVQRLLNDVGDNLDQLPLLQHALMRAWDEWAQHDPPKPGIDLDDLKAVGGLEDALSRHADDTHAKLGSDRARGIARCLFQCLAERGADNRELRRPMPVAQLAAIGACTVDELVRVVDAFRAPGRSFLMPAAGTPLDGTTVIDISHESLIRQWLQMRRWVDEEAESSATYLRIVEAARLHRIRRGGLWRDPELAEAQRWRERESPNLAWARRYRFGCMAAMRFLRLSAAALQEARADEQARLQAEREARELKIQQADALAQVQHQLAEDRRKRLRDRSIIMAAAGLVMAGLTAYAVVKGLEAREAQRKLALSLEEVKKEKKRADEQTQLAQDWLASLQKQAATLDGQQLRDALNKPVAPGTLTQREETQLTTKLEAGANATPAQTAKARTVGTKGLTLWRNGATLQLRFLGGSEAQHLMAQQAAAQWTEHANVKFVVSQADAQLRIAFKPGEGSWSYVGNQALAIPLTEPTMNLGSADVAAMVHEFGHALGLIHESDNPHAKLPWLKEVVYREMAAAPTYWSKAITDANYFRQNKDIDYRPFDPDSIMMPTLPGHWFADGIARGGNQVLSASDKAFIAQLYPR